MRLPNGARAYIEPAKVFDYLLNPAHPRGRNKARLFAAALGLQRQDGDALIRWLAAVAADSDKATASAQDAYGERFEIRVGMRYNGRVAMVRTAWIIRSGESFPRFVTAYPE